MHRPAAWPAAWPKPAFDLARHNAEVQEVWQAFHAGRPIRVPVILGSTPRILLLDPAYNRAGTTFRQYFDDPRVMFRWQVLHAHWVRTCLLQDIHMGPPAAGWEIEVDFQNVRDAAWFGNEIVYLDGQVPDTEASITDAGKAAFLERDLPGPWDGIMGRYVEFYEHFQALAADFEYAGAGVGRVNLPPGHSFDGPFTTACKLRGPAEFCLDLLLDEAFARALLDRLTEATIARVQAWRQRLPPEPHGFVLADDLIQLLSVEQFCDFVLPCHRRIYDELVLPGGVRFMHLCGDHLRFFPILHDAVNVTTFDTGFPLDFGRARAELGPEVLIQGGPPIALLLEGTPPQIEAEVRRVLHSGVAEGGRFILREANDLAPETPLTNAWAMYAAGRRHGAYALAAP
jgi:uroporphyrinogen-III decarboxylase